MPNVYPFRAVQYAAQYTASVRGDTADLSSLISPPYDVLDAAAKAALLARDERNIVAVDLPHLPAKELGPPSAYQAAATLYEAWLRGSTLKRRPNPGMTVYRQTFQSGGSLVQRKGMACTVEVLPFGPRDGGGILPHEQTFSGPKEDRLALMKATMSQLSPIFGLHADERGAAKGILDHACRGPADATAVTTDGTRHDVWTIEDAATIEAYTHALAGEDIFIADGHHRYNTALNYLMELESRAPVPRDHPARRCMMVLVGMSDPGLTIWPTHRVLGGMSGYSIDALRAALKPWMTLADAGRDLAALERELNAPARAAKRALGFHDFATGACFLAECLSDDPLAADFAGKPRAWRELDVAIVQHLVVERACQPVLNAGKPVQWAFPHTIAEVQEIGRGGETGAGGGKGFIPQLAVVVRPTPLGAVKSISRAGELMPQKSTFFYPKLATGLFINPLA